MTFNPVLLGSLVTRAAAEPLARWLHLATAPVLVAEPIEIDHDTPAGREARMLRQIASARAAGML